MLRTFQKSAKVIEGNLVIFLILAIVAGGCGDQFYGRLSRLAARYGFVIAGKISESVWVFVQTKTCGGDDPRGFGV